MRLGVVKQSFFGLPGQYGRRVTKANMGDSLSHLDNLLIPVIASSDRNLVRPYSTSEQRVTLCYFLKAMLLVQETMCYVLDTFVPPCFFFFWLLPLGHERHEQLSLVPSLTQRLFFATPIALIHDSHVGFLKLSCKLAMCYAGGGGGQTLE